MERTKSEYLQKILEQVNIQNAEYFENLACEYTLQLQQIEVITTEGQDIESATNILFGKVNEDQLTEEQISYLKFMRKPEIIKMHLDILFKSISFLKQEKIDTMLLEYKEQKAQK
jgi:hypothetical protein